MKRILTLLLICCLTITGCSNILIADDTVLPIKNGNPNIATIDTINMKQPGKVCSITEQGTLLSINQQSDSLYSIDQYNPSNSTLVNITTSENRIFDVKAAGNGFFYTRNSLTDPGNIQITWSSYDKTTERTITTAADSVDDTIYAYDGDKVIFLNNGNELIFSNSTGTRKVYTLSFPIEVREIIWSSDPSIGFIIANIPQEDVLTLYEVRLTKDDNVSVIEIERNVPDMDLSKNGELIYLNRTTGRTIVYLISNVETTAAEPLFSEELIDKVIFSDNEGIIYSVQETSGVRSNLWYFSREDESKTQLTSSIRLISSLFSTKSNQLVYSVSQQSYLEQNNIIETNNYISNLIFTLQ